MSVFVMRSQRLAASVRRAATFRASGSTIGNGVSVREALRVNGRANAEDAEAGPASLRKRVGQSLGEGRQLVGCVVVDEDDLVGSAVEHLGDAVEAQGDAAVRVVAAGVISAVDDDRDHGSVEREAGGLVESPRATRRTRSSATVSDASEAGEEYVAVASTRGFVVEKPPRWKPARVAEDQRPLRAVNAVIEEAGIERLELLLGRVVLAERLPRPGVRVRPAGLASGHVLERPHALVDVHEVEEDLQQVLVVVVAVPALRGDPLALPPAAAPSTRRRRTRASTTSRGTRSRGRAGGATRRRGTTGRRARARRRSCGGARRTPCRRERGRARRPSRGRPRSR